MIPKRPRDPNQLAKAIVDIATAEPEPDASAPDPKGRAGGLVGGRTRAVKLSTERRREIAKKAAAMRWKSEAN